MFGKSYLRVPASMWGAALLLLFAQSSIAGDFVVVINANNTYSADSAKVAAEVKRMFLRQVEKWPDGSGVLVLDRASDSEAHQRFVVSVLGMDAARLAHYWAQLKQTRGVTPPRNVSTMSLLLRYLGRKPGALTFAAKSEYSELPPTVRVLMEY